MHRATLERYEHRNEMIGRKFVYIVGLPFEHRGLARIEVDGRPVTDGTVATVVGVYDFDFPYLYELSDGRRTRSGGSGWHAWDEVTGEWIETDTRTHACQCESSLCDHNDSCPRPVQGHVKMAFVEDCCATCAANMGATGGASYLFTAEEWDAA